MEYIENCTLCPRNCHAKRNAENGLGYCKTGTLPKIARVAPHMWEEPCISGNMGSGTIFFSGCVLSCVFCQNSKISTGGYGKTVSVDKLIEYIKRLEDMGVHNINLVSPTPYIYSIIECFEKYRPSVPIVYNTGGYEKVDTLKKLDGIVDVYLPDMKYIDSEISARYSKADDYFEFASESIKEMVRQTGVPQFDEYGIMKKGTIVRHLVLPQNIKNSLNVLKWLNDTFDKKILVSIMCQYIPLGDAIKYSEINRRITKREYNKVIEYIENLQLEGFIQDMMSARKEYVPDFDIEKL